MNPVIQINTDCNYDNRLGTLSIKLKSLYMGMIWLSCKTVRPVSIISTRFAAVILSIQKCWSGYNFH